MNPLVSLPALLLPPRPAAWPRVLMYHQVTAAAPASGMNCPPEVFARHLRLLQRRGVRFCTLSELAQRAAAGEPRLLALTLDDGYADNYEEMFPLLEQFDAKATIFYATAYDAIRRFDGPAARRMVGSGRVELGSHTLSHVNLTTLDDAAAAREITASKAAVEDLVGEPCRAFAYPFGRFTPRHAELVAAAGYQLAVTTRKRIQAWADTDPLRIPRLSTHGAAGRWQFGLMLSRGRFRL
jgi:peptidoglycan/xylan/chitin deacetylase (PgdA/CDA1 family)